MILTDGTHLISDTSEEELHEFWNYLGFKRSWFQDGKYPHYDLTTKNAYKKALNAGAVQCPPRNIILKHWNKKFQGSK